MFFYKKHTKAYLPLNLHEKKMKKHEFYTKLCGLYSLEHFFQKICFCYSPLQSSLKHHFFFKKINFLLFHEKSGLSKRIPQKRLKKSPRSSKMKIKISFTFPTKVRGVRLCLSIWWGCHIHIQCSCSGWDQKLIPSARARQLSAERANR